MKLARTEWLILVAITACVIGLALIVPKAIKDIGTAAKEVDNNGGVKAVVTRIWEGAPEKAKP